MQPCPPSTQPHTCPIFPAPLQVFYNEFNADLVGVTFPTAAGKATVLCCTKDLVPHTCDRAGEAIIQGLNANTTAKPAQGSLPRLLPIRMTETVKQPQVGVRCGDVGALCC